MKNVTIYTDGACSGNPGPGGWGAILQYGAATRELSGSEPSTTNNRMELFAAIQGLAALREPCDSISQQSVTHQQVSLFLHQEHSLFLHS